MKKIIEESCKCNIIHKDIIEKVKSKMHDEDILYGAAELFKVFGDLTRTKIIAALFQSELCVCDIASLLNMTKSAVSHQGSILFFRR
mgnify:CR=1 FL=1